MYPMQREELSARIEHRYESFRLTVMEEHKSDAIDVGI